VASISTRSCGKARPATASRVGAGRQLAWASLGPIVSIARKNASTSVTYSLTPKGREALRAWARGPVRFPRVLHEGVARLLAADLVGEKPVRESITMLRWELDELDALTDKAEEGAAILPHREKYLRINHRLARRLIAAHREWIAEVERELS
jgi:DNA-binding PadR family transcriptional regulator